MNHPYKRYHGVSLMFKKIFQPLAMVLLYSIPVLQVFMATIPIITILLLQIIYHPHNRQATNFINIFTEMSFLAVHFLLLVLAFDDNKPIIEDSTKESFGAIIIGICLLMILVELIVIVHEQYQTYKEIYQSVKKWLTGEQKSQKKRKLKTNTHIRKYVGNSSFTYKVRRS